MGGGFDMGGGMGGFGMGGGMGDGHHQQRQQQQDLYGDSSPVTALSSANFPTKDSWVWLVEVGHIDSQLLCMQLSRLWPLMHMF
jgi:hypothetical protein